MDELITPLTSAGRRAGVPLHHPGLTAIRIWCGGEGARPLTSRRLSSLPRWQSCQVHGEVVPQQLLRLAPGVSAVSRSRQGKPDTGACQNLIFSPTK